MPHNRSAGVNDTEAAHSARGTAKINLPPGAESEPEKMEPYHPVDAFDLLGQNLQKPPEIIHGILHQGSKMVIGGGSKSFKTWTLVDLGLSVAAGTFWWGFETTQSKVLYVNFEIQDAFFADRLSSIIEAKELALEPGQFSYLGLRGKIDDFGFPMEKLKATVIGESYGVIIIDPIYKGLGDKDENRAGDIASLLNQMESLAVESGAAVVFGHHFSKGNQSGKEAIDRMSGSGVFARDPDTILMMTPQEEEDVFVIDCILRNLKPVEKFCVKREHPLMVRSDLHDPTKLKQVGGSAEKYSDADILAPLDGTPGLTFTDYKQAVVTSTGMSSRTFVNRVEKLINQGKLEEKR
ncbi:MAG: AAA family ATPase [Chthoniobacteraceae bacterium]